MSMDADAIETLVEASNEDGGDLTDIIRGGIEQEASAEEKKKRTAAGRKKKDAPESLAHEHILEKEGTYENEVGEAIALLTEEKEGEDLELAEGEVTLTEEDENDEIDPVTKKRKRRKISKDLALIEKDAALKGTKNLWKEEAEHPDGYKSGKWSKAEDDLLRSAFHEYLDQQQISYDEGVRRLCIERTHRKRFRGAWIQITKKIPLRRVQSVYLRGARILPKAIQTGKWTPGEVERLLELVKEHSHEWSKIGRLLNRLPMSCRDRWRETASKDKGNWTEEEIHKLVELVKASIPGQPQDAAALAAATVPWTKIAKEMDGRSHSQCRCKWRLYLNSLHPISEFWKNEHSLKLVQKVYETSLADESEIIWTDIAKGFEWTTQQCRNKFSRLIKGAQGETFSEKLQNTIDKLTQQIAANPNGGQPKRTRKRNSLNRSLVGDDLSYSGEMVAGEDGMEGMEEENMEQVEQQEMGNIEHIVEEQGDHQGEIHESVDAQGTGVNIEAMVE